MDAAEVYRDKRNLDDGSIVEAVIWRVAEPVPGCNHPYRYRLYYGRPGITHVLYDNHAGKGDHRHVGGKEEPYPFTDVETLMRDFTRDVQQHRSAGP